LLGEGAKQDCDMMPCKLVQTDMYTLCLSEYHNHIPDILSHIIKFQTACRQRFTFKYVPHRKHRGVCYQQLSVNNTAGLQGNIYVYCGNSKHRTISQSADICNLSKPSVNLYTTSLCAAPFQYRIPICHLNSINSSLFVAFTHVLFSGICELRIHVRYNVG
jgi:hypothetical protein